MERASHAPAHPCCRCALPFWCPAGGYLGQSYSANSHFYEQTGSAYAETAMSFVSGQSVQVSKGALGSSCLQLRPPVEDP